MRILALILVLSPIVANADIPVPNQELCTVEIQQRDGSRCDSCSWVGYEQGAQEAACGSLVERGLVRRCGYGATHAVAVHCDREANWLEVGGAESASSESASSESASSGCNCDAASAGGYASFALLSALLLTRGRKLRSPH